MQESAERRATGRPWTAWSLGLPDAWALLLAVLLVSPVRLAGYPLGRDMVFTPHQPLNADSVGLGSAAPRAVPLDAVVALVSRALDGAALGRIALLVPLVLAGCGAWRLLPAGGGAEPGQAAWTVRAARFVTAGFAVWNPYVVERLALGQWALLWAYGALPWLLLVAHRLRTGGAARADTAKAFSWLAASSITPTGGLISSAVLLLAGWRRRGRDSALLLLIVLITQLPWLVPALTSPAGLTSDSAGVAAFAARSERGGGAFLSLVGLGGIWDAGATPRSRAGLLGYLTTAVVLGCLLVGAVGIRRAGDTPVRRLLPAALAGLVLAALTVLPGGAALLRLLIRTVPGAGLLRDGQKWLLPFVLLAAVCVGMAIQHLGLLIRQAAIAVAALALVLPMLLLPDAIATVRPTLSPVRYPAGWYRASAALRSSTARGDVLSLPFASYRSFGWITASSVIDPAPRWIGRSVVVEDRLVVGGRLLGGEDRRAAEISALLQRDNRDPAALAHDLADAGIGYVWVETGTAGPALPDLSGLPKISDGPGVTLLQVPGDVASVHRSVARAAAVLGVDLLAGTALLAALVVMAVQGIRGCYTRR